MRSTLLLCFFLFIAVLTRAQQPHASDAKPCGTPPFTDPWLVDFLENRDKYALSRTSDTLYIGMQVHLTARDNGTGRLRPSKLLDAFCTLNRDFEPAGVRFYFKYDWNEIDNTDYFDHEELTDGIQMMYDNDIPDALNIYFCANPAGNAGYNIPYASIAMGNAYSGPAAHTWAHEIGHAFTLQHTFLGWENTAYNYGTQTPDTVIYDYTHFHFEPDTILPAPLDTALVEYADFSNCYVSADKFCDTPPDYLAYRWDCDQNNMSIAQQKDPNGVEFKSDGTLFMSYADDACSSRFSDEQIQALRANIETVKQAWLAQSIPDQFIDGEAELMSPVAGQNTPPSNVSFHWASVPEATQYIIQASRFSNFGIVELEEVTSDTFFQGGTFAPNKTYYWRVRPFNNSYTCTDFSEKQTFFTDLTLSAATLDESGFKYYPNPIRPGIPLTVEIPETWLGQETSIQIFDLSGKLLGTQNIQFNERLNRINLPSTLHESGMYYAVLESARGRKVLKLVY